jgi:F0F1-type ATP synthase assembly protein I
MLIATRIALYQLLVGAVAGAVWWWALGTKAAVAALAGGAASALLSYYTALKTFGGSRQDPNAMLRDFFRAQAWKYVIAGLMFVVAIKLFSGQFLPFITAFGASLSIYWFSLLWKE